MKYQKNKEKKKQEKERQDIKKKKGENSDDLQNERIKQAIRKGLT